MSSSNNESRTTSSKDKSCKNNSFTNMSNRKIYNNNNDTYIAPFDRITIKRCKYDNSYGSNWGDFLSTN